MKSEVKTCQNCKAEFTIEPEDFVFYDKIKVPAPTFCPHCRLQRRLAFTNIFRLYKRKCDLCSKEVLSRYSTDKKYKIYCPLCWWGDGWDAMDYARDYDFSKPFFQQFAELWWDAPMLAVSVDLQTAQESPYVNDAGYLKQCYLLFTSDTAERCAYGYYVVRSHDCVDSTAIMQCELMYDSFHAFKNYHGIHLFWSNYNNNSAFLFNSENCQDCFGSINLRHKQYYFFNEHCTKEDYLKRRAATDLGSYWVYGDVKKKFAAHALKFPVRSHWHDFSQNVSGILVFNSKNCQHCFETVYTEDSKYIAYMVMGTVKDSYDYTSWGRNAELIYESMTVGDNSRNIRFSEEAGMGLSDIEYTKLGIGSSNLFGCVGVRNKSYCILNKQYSEEEYKKLREKIIKHMQEMPFRDCKGIEYRYGEFFPVELSPFAYNETLAGVHYSLPKEEVLRQGYSWKDEEKTEYSITLPAKDLPDHIKDAKDDILKEVIGCLKCGRAFKLIPQELAFYRKMNVPLPRECFFCRLKEKMDQQPHPLRWFKRKCQCTGKGSENGIYQNVTSHQHGERHCQDEFDTWYAPDHPEIVYCEQCYQAEVV